MRWDNRVLVKVHDVVGKLQTNPLLAILGVGTRVILGEGSVVKSYALLALSFSSATVVVPCGCTLVGSKAAVANKWKVIKEASADKLVPTLLYVHNVCDRCVVLVVAGRLVGGGVFGCRTPPNPFVLIHTRLSLDAM